MNYYRFTIVWMSLFALVFAALLSLGIAPANMLKMRTSVLTAFTPVEAASEDSASVLLSSQPEARTPFFREAIDWPHGVQPERIVIEKIGVSSPIMNPDTTETSALDAELKKGVVRYPGSGFLNEDSNMFLFGHSTGLKNVRNKAYEAFNNLDKLNVGDVISVYAKDSVYEYRVTSVSLAKAEEALVTFSTGKKTLTLSTCNTFGKKEDRFVVTAEFVGQKTITENI